MSSYVKISGLSWANIVAVYPIWILMTYLTNVWKLHLTHAAAIINVFQGSYLIFPIFMSFLLDAYMGDFYLLVLSSVAYSFGLSFLAMSTPPVLSKLVGNCSAYEPECIGSTQKALFYTALPLISIGQAGYIYSLKTFTDTHVNEFTGGINNNETVDRRPSNVYYVMGTLCAVLLQLVAYPLPVIHSWAILFGIPAICMVLATLTFLSGSFSYIKTPATAGSLMTTIFRVLVASTSKKSHRTPTDAYQLYESTSPPNSLAHTPSLSYLDKAAIILADTALEQQELNRWKLCSVTEVEMTKTVIRMMPMIMAHFMIGTLTSIQTSFFLEQANNMNPRVGWLFKSLPICFAFYKVGMAVAGTIYSFVAGLMLGLGTEKYLVKIGFLMAMAASTLCCLTAAIVEKTRLDYVMMQHYIPRNTSNMSILWMLPQFLLLGAVDRLFVANGLPNFFKDDEAVPTILLPLVQQFAWAFYGLGHIGSVLFVYILGEVTGSGDNLSWFQETLNKSRLDKYYWTLTVISIAIMVLYVLSLCYKFQAMIRRPGDETLPLIRQEEHID